MGVKLPSASSRLGRIAAGLLVGAMAIFALDSALRQARRAPAPASIAPTTIMRDSLAVARDLIRQRDFAGAEARARSLLDRTERATGPASLETAEVLDFLVEIARTRGVVDAPEAMACAERAVQIKEQILPADDLRIASSLIQLADLRQRGGDYRQALPLVERALSIRTRALGQDNLLVASTFDNLGIVLRQLADYRGAKRCFESALGIRRKLLEADDPELARSFHYLGIVSTDLGDYRAALRFYADALSIRDRRFKADDPRIAETLSNLADLHVRCGRYVEARPLFERALTIREANGNLGRLAETLNNIAGFLQASGDYEGARVHCERSLEIRRQIAGPDSWLVAASLVTLADIHQDLGDYAAALSCYEEALRIDEGALGPEHPEVAQCIGGLAELLRNTGDTVAAGQLCKRAVAMQQRFLESDHPEVAISLQRLGRALLDAGDPTAAVPLLRQALAIQEKRLSAHHEAVGRTLVDLAAARCKTGEAGEARHLFARARRVLERALGLQHPDLAVCLATEGDFLVAQGETKAARTDYAIAARILESAYGPADPTLGQVLCKQAKLDARARDSRAAFERSLRGESIGRETLALTARTLPERRALRYSATRASGLGVALSLLLEPAGGIEQANARAWDACIRSRALVLDEMAARQRALKSGGDLELDRLAAALVAARGRLSWLTVRGAGEAGVDEYRMLVDAARQEKERAERALAERSVIFRHEQRKSRAGLAEVTAALPPASALIAFVCFDREALEESLCTRDLSTPWYVAFVMSPGASSPFAVPIGPADAVESAVSRWMAAVAGGGKSSSLTPEASERRYRQTGSELRRKLWDPIAPFLAGAKRVFVVPDAALHLVSLAALPVGAREYLAESGPVVHYLSAERDLLPEESTATPGRGLLALGGCDFDAVPVRTAAAELAPPQRSGELVDATPSIPVLRGETEAGRGLGTYRFRPLPASEQEIAEIAALWRNADRRHVLDPKGAGTEALAGGPCTCFVGRQASEAAFKRNAPGKRIVHVATHGFFLGLGAKALGASGRGIAGLEAAPRAMQRTLAGESPLLLAGLALAGVNNRIHSGSGEDDGVLTAEEIAGLDLQGVEWVVLSACNTGVGETRAGEGVFGLRRAFAIAGARTLVMSLWPVEDDGARQCMHALYAARLEDGRSTSDAVHAAQLATLEWSRLTRQSGHPFHWAGFVAAGDWR